MSSTHSPTCGNRSETIFPHCPYGLKFHRGSTIRPTFFLPPRPNVFTSTV